MLSQPRGRLWALVAGLVAVIAVAGSIRWSNRRTGPTRTGLLQTKIAERAFEPGASADDLFELAAQTAEQLLADHPNDPRAVNVQARRHYSLIETEAASELWRMCLELDPNFADAYFGLGLVAMDRGDYQAAVERFEDVARLDREDPRVPVLLAKSVLLDGRAEEATLILEQHVTTGRTSAEAWELLGQAHLQAQRFDRAVQCLELAVEALPNKKDALYGLSRAYAGLGNSEKSAAYDKRFRELDAAVQAKNAAEAKANDPRFAWQVAAQTYVDAARVRHHHGDWRRAEDCLLRAVLLQPENVDFLTQLQRSLQGRGENARAAEVSERIVALAPRQLDQWLNLGWLYSNLDEPELAIAACQKAIELDPDDPRCRQAHEIIQRLQ